ncbi:MAG: AmmeMemoRadiSam system protein B [bacterium]
MKLPAVVRGQFYPDRREDLRKLFKSFESLPAAQLSGEPLGLLLPYAGYPYSGALAALGYRSLPKDLETIVVAGPSHYVRFQGISLFAGEAVETPWGDLPVDQESCRFLLDQTDAFLEFEPAFAREHSVEVHFPLIRKYCPNARVVPLVMGQGKSFSVEPLVAALHALRRQKPFLLVASSDLSHYPSYETAVAADRRFLSALISGDEERIESVDREILAENHPDYFCTHCGPEPHSALTRWAKLEKAQKIQLLSYRNSGDVTGDHSRVVGYAAAAFCK